MKLQTIIMLLFISTDAFCQASGVVEMNALTDFPVLTREGKASNRRAYGPFRAEKDLNALAGDDLNYTFQMAAAEGKFPGKAGKYTVNLNTLTERDGECVYNVYINDERVGLFRQNPPTNEFTAPATLTWSGVEIPVEATIRVESNNWSNLKRHEGNFYEYARGRWTGIIFVPETTDSNAGNRKMTGIFEKYSLIGSSGIKPMVTYNDYEQAYYLAFRPSKIPDGQGPIYYLYNEVTGDFDLEALVTLISVSENPAISGGLMIRESSDPESPFIACALSGKDKGYVRVKDERGGEVRESYFGGHVSEMIEIVKTNDLVSISTSGLGDDYDRHVIKFQSTGHTMIIGFFISSVDNSADATARFSHVRFFKASPSAY